jgi:predicted DNA-binding ribbon-helix-helix protein
MEAVTPKGDHAMCEIFISTEADNYDAKTRSVRLHGVVTSIRLENLFWNVLQEIGQRDGMSVTQLIEKLYDELVEARGDVGNFTSFLRVCALRYMKLQAHGAIPVDVSIPIGSLNAKAVLQVDRAHAYAPMLQEKPRASNTSLRGISSKHRH